MKPFIQSGVMILSNLVSAHSSFTMRTAGRAAADYWTHPENKANKDGGGERVQNGLKQMIQF